MHFGASTGNREHKERCIQTNRQNGITKMWSPVMIQRGGTQSRPEQVCSEERRRALIQDEC